MYSRVMDNSEINPQNILASAIRKVPAVRYALGVAGVAAAVALILGLLRDIRIAFFGIAFAFALMVVLLIFSHMVQDLPGKRWMAAFLAWIVITLFSAMLITTFTSIVFGFPQKFALFWQADKEPSGAVSEQQQAPTGPMEDLPSGEVFKLKPDDYYPDTDEKQKQIEWSIHNDSSWIVKEVIIKLVIISSSTGTKLHERYYRLHLSPDSSGEAYKTSKYIGEYVFPSQYSGDYYSKSYSIESAKGVKP
jgi:hypothetical protein